MALFDLVEAGEKAETAVPVNPGKKPPSSGVEWLREEMDGYLEQMKQFHHMPVDEVFRLLSGWTARATELRIQLNRSDNQRASSFRTKEIEPFLEECERQFKFHSRIQATHELDLKMVRGQT